MVITNDLFPQRSPLTIISSFSHFTKRYNYQAASKSQSSATP